MKPNWKKQRATLSRLRSFALISSWTEAVLLSKLCNFCKHVCRMVGQLGIFSCPYLNKNEAEGIDSWCQMMPEKIYWNPETGSLVPVLWFPFRLTHFYIFFNE